MFSVRKERRSLIISFPQPTLTLGWAVLNGGFCAADHIINHHVSGADAAFMKNPGRFLDAVARDLGLGGKVVGMATAVDLDLLVTTNFLDGGAEVSCFATVGWGNALSVGEPATWTEENGKPLDTINLIVLAAPALSAAAMVEAIQIATEGRVRALYEAGIVSSRSHLPATGTGTDCVTVASLEGVGSPTPKDSRSLPASPYCGKHTKLGEMIGLAAYTAVQQGLAKGSATAAS